MFSVPPTEKLNALFGGILRLTGPSRVQFETVIVSVPPTRVRVTGAFGTWMITTEFLEPVPVNCAGCPGAPVGVTAPVVVALPLTGFITTVPAPLTTSSPKSRSACFRTLSDFSITAFPVELAETGAACAASGHSSISSAQSRGKVALNIAAAVTTSGQHRSSAYGKRRIYPDYCPASCPLLFRGGDGRTCNPHRCAVEDLCGQRGRPQARAERG